MSEQHAEALRKRRLKARELLADNYERAGLFRTANSTRNGKYDNSPEIRAIMAALALPQMED